MGPLARSRVLGVRRLGVCALVVLSACDALLLEPAERRSVPVEIVLDPTRAGVGSNVDVTSWGVREVGFRFSRGEVTRDTAVVGRFADGVLSAAVWLHPEELTNGLVIRAEVRARNGLVMFSGEGTLSNPIIAPSVSLHMAPNDVIVLLSGAPVSYGSGEIALTEFDGNPRMALPIVHGRSVDVSPRDGTIVGDLGGALTLLDPYTGERRAIGADRGFRWTAGPQFSSDGQWIYFQAGAQIGQPSGVFRIRPDDSDLEAVFTSTDSWIRDVGSPGLSPDGSALVLAGSPIQILDLATNGLRSLGVTGWAVRWSPDGERIAYRDVVDRLRVIGVDGSGDRILAETATVGVFDWIRGGRVVLAATNEGVAFSIDVDSGVLQARPEFGPVAGISVLTHQ